MQAVPLPCAAQPVDEDIRVGQLREAARSVVAPGECVCEISTDLLDDRDPQQEVLPFERLALEDLAHQIVGHHVVVTGEVVDEAHGVVRGGDPQAGKA